MGAVRAAGRLGIQERGAHVARRETRDMVRDVRRQLRRLHEQLLDFIRLGRAHFVPLEARAETLRQSFLVEVGRADEGALFGHLIEEREQSVLRVALAQIDLVNHDRPPARAEHGRRCELKCPLAHDVNRDVPAVDDLHAECALREMGRQVLSQRGLAHAGRPAKKQFVPGLAGQGDGQQVGEFAGMADEIVG